MKLSELLNGVEVKNQYDDREVKDVVSNTKKDVEDCLFVCVAGKKFDPHSCAGEMLERGAAAVLVERDMGLKNQIIVENTRKELSVICANLFGHPSKKLKLIGVTGTNGKTTTTYLIRTILELLGHKTGLIGSVQNIAGDIIETSVYTTPEPHELQELFAKMVGQGCEYCVMEVSSQSLSQYRVFGCEYEQAIFTNLTHDHLDYHGTMENYMLAKKELFKASKKAIINIDDAWAEKIVEGLNCDVVRFSMNDNRADYIAKNVKLKKDGVEYEVVGDGVITRAKVPYPGEFSVYNSLGAAVSVIELGNDFYKSVEALSHAQGIKGRIEVVPTGTDYTVIIDYAHTPDGLEKILKCVRQFAPGRVVIVFGCGGERDKAKRPVMGRVAARLADFIVITADNPKSEGPEPIVSAVVAGMKDIRTPYVSIYNRKEAVEFALAHARKDDIIVLTGRGHEELMHTKEGTFHFDEREIIRDFLASRKASVRKG